MEAYFFQTAGFCKIFVFMLQHRVCVKRMRNVFIFD